MRIFVLTQEEPFHLPVFFQNLFMKNKEIVGIGIGKRHNTSFLKMAMRHYHFFGLKEFIIHGLLTIIYKIKDQLCHEGSKKFYSVQKTGDYAGVGTFRVENINDTKFIEFLKERIKPDLIVSISFSQILKKEVLDIPALGCINIHSGRLPDYRGMLPTFWAMVNGEKEIGVTIHYINEKIDEGDIIVQLGVPIDKNDTLHSVIAKSKARGLEALLIAFNKIRKGAVDTIKNDPSRGSYFSFPARKDAIRFKELGWKFR